MAALDELSKIISLPRTLIYATSPVCMQNPVSIHSRQGVNDVGAGMKEREPTILFTPFTEFLPNMGGRQVKKISYDGVAFRTRRQARTRTMSTQSH